MTFPRDELHVSCFINFCFLASTEALEFAKTKLTPFGKMQKYIQKLEVCLSLSQIFLATSIAFICFVVMTYICCCHQDFMALFAYEELDKSPMFHLLGLEYRQQVADSLNRAILGLLLDSYVLLCTIFKGCSEDLCFPCKDQLLSIYYCYTIYNINYFD